MARREVDPAVPTPETRHHRGGQLRFERARSVPPVPGYARFVIVAALLALIVIFSWNKIGPAYDRLTGTATPPQPVPVPIRPAAPLWQTDAMNSLAAAAQHAKAGDVTAAEVAVDRAASIIESARIQNERTASGFFAPAIAAMDAIVQQNPKSADLFDHVMQARLSLAALRSAQSSGGAAVVAAQTTALANLVSGPLPQTPKSKGVVLAEPREIAANSTLDPASLGSDYLDATQLPTASEVLLPPSDRLLSENVRVENLTIAGSAQTLDGIHWRNVTFVGTRLRYEDGGLDLQNVRFVGCTFGFPSDAQSARLADAIALSKSSFSFTSDSAPAH